MSYLIVFLVGVLAGAIAGILTYRNNQSSVEAKAKALESDVEADLKKVAQVADAINSDVKKL